MGTALLAAVVAVGLLPAGAAWAGTSAQGAGSGDDAVRPERPPTSYEPMSSAEEAKLTARALAAAEPDTGKTELVKERTRMSRTFTDPVSGTRVTQLSASPINFQDAEGAWQPIDNVLQADKSGGGWRNGANAYTLNLPKSLVEPVKIADGADAGAFVSVQLAPDATPVDDLGSGSAQQRSSATADAPEVSDTTATVKEAEATYSEALPGVDFSYEAIGDAVKETASVASLADLDALPGGSLSFTVKTGAGMTLKVLESGAVDVVNAQGQTTFEIPPPVMNDAHGEPSAAITTLVQKNAGGQDGDAWTMTLTPDRQWLAAEGRAWPVAIDPTIGVGAPMAACTLQSNAAATDPALCSGSEILTSWNSNGGAERRALLRFDTLLDVVPADAQIATARLSLSVVDDSAFPASTVDVRALTSSFTTSANWTTRDGSTTWGTAGGDRSDVYERKELKPDGTYQDLDVSRLVQEWTEGGSEHNGFILQKQASAAGGDFLRFGSPQSSRPPSLFVEWEPRTGVRKGNTAVVTEELSDRTSVSVNPATGNASVTTKELSIAGSGIDLNVAHTSQSLDTDGLGVDGYGWTSSLTGTRLWPYDGGTTGAAQTMFYRDGSGGQWTYLRNKNVSNTWIRPKGLDKDLAVPDSSHYSLTDRTSQTKELFKNIGTDTDQIYALESVTDRNGNKITFTYDASARSQIDGTLILRSVTDTRGREIEVTNYSGYFNDFITDSSDRQIVYSITGNQLESVTDAAGGTVRYEYDSAHRVTAVVTTEDLRTEMQYDAQGRITKLTRKNSAAGGDSVWTFSYGDYTRDSEGKPTATNTVTDPNGHTTEYTANGRGLVSKAKNALGKSVSKTYSPNDDVASTTGATGGGTQTATSDYESAGDTYRMTSTKIPTGAGMTINSYGTGASLYNPTKQTDSRGNATTYTYNTGGNRASEKKADGSTTVSLYEGDTDPAYGDVVHCGPGSTPTATKAGALCETRDAEYVKGSSRAATGGHRTAYRYNDKGELVTTIPPSGGSLANQTYTYDGLSRLQTLTDGKGQETYYGYDALDRLIYVQHADGSTESSHYGGDNTGNNNGWLRSVKEQSATGAVTRLTDYGRDDLGRLTAVSAPEGVASLSYDKASNLKVYNDGGGIVTYGYNDADQLTWVQMPGGNCAGLTYAAPGDEDTGCILLQVDDDGRRTGTKYPGGTSVQANTLDDSGRIKQIVAKTGATTQLNLTYSYTEASKDTGLVNSVTDAVTSKKTTYTHDGQDRLSIASTTPIGGESATTYEAFCYSAAGNRTKYYTAADATCSTTNPAATYTYNTANQLTGATGTTPTGATLTGTGFTYDANGNETTAKSATGRTTTYGDRDQATSFTPTGGTTTGQTYAGTGNGNRLTSGTTTFMASPLSPAPAWSKTGGTTTWTVRDPDGKLLAIRVGPTDTSTSEYYPFMDNLDNVRAMVTATGGAPEVAYTYSAYGVITASSGSLSQPYRYGGGYTDAVTGLVKTGARFYDTTSGRFTQPDPTKQEAHPYLYAGGCPSSHRDPAGTSWLGDALQSPKVGCIAGMVALGLAGASLLVAAPPAGLLAGSIFWGGVGMGAFLTLGSCESAGWNYYS
ncbi:DNRLRE domain-containing protein [Kineosporia sp. J2-2]|uniref:DNRLRE domain-containing protein n=1 Tax=Kineosporia corallincola TaxID=2835133 RepID=A0ABS5TTY1_9ACTN|nr:DNRLRE domain-containing protein [Kineosporia corallincola]MBT0774267.1 DNRLRE domain-containing protein [Kineosporia corallincola]